MHSVETDDLIPPEPISGLCSDRTDASVVYVTLTTSEWSDAKRVIIS